MTITVTAAEARSQFSRIANQVSATGVPVTVFRNSRPWVVIQPIAGPKPTPATAQAMDEAQELLASPPRFTGYEDFMTALRAVDADS